MENLRPSPGTGTPSGTPESKREVNRKLLLILLLASRAHTQPVVPLVVPTAQYDNQRTGANLNETTLTPRNVNPAHFGKLFAIPVDGDVYAQPLYVPNLEIPGKGVHNVIFIATEHDTVYALDAAGQPATPLWQVSFINPAAGLTAVAERDMVLPFHFARSRHHLHTCDRRQPRTLLRRPRTLGALCHAHRSRRTRIHRHPPRRPRVRPPRSPRGHPLINCALCHAHRGRRTRIHRHPPRGPRVRPPRSPSRHPLIPADFGVA